MARPIQFEKEITMRVRQSYRKSLVDLKQTHYMHQQEMGRSHKNTKKLATILLKLLELEQELS